MINKENFNSTRLLQDLGEIQLWQIGDEWATRFNDFAYNIYESIRSKKATWNSEQIKSEMKNDTEFYFSKAKVCAVMTPQQELIGTWGLIWKDSQVDEFKLPIERKFDLSTDKINEIMKTESLFFFNGWRTAVDKGFLDKMGYDTNKSIFIFDLLLKGLTVDFGDKNKFIMGVSEMENLVLRYHKRIGIPWHKLGEPKTYWGNTKFPCGFKLNEFVTNMKAEHRQRYDFIFDN